MTTEEIKAREEWRSEIGITPAISQIKSALEDADSVQEGHPEDIRCLISHLKNALTALEPGVGS